MYLELQVLGDQLNEDSLNMRQNNVPKTVTKLKDGMLSLIKTVSKYKRTAATHALVIMISPEERRQKPYALPVQCVPYRSLTDNMARNLVNKVIKEMLKRRMKVAGNHDLFQ